jgi:hypothetical protein
LTTENAAGPMAGMEQDRTSHPPGRSVADLRRQREAEALRENLRRRKEQQRSREDAEARREEPSRGTGSPTDLAHDAKRAPPDRLKHIDQEVGGK